MLRHAVYAGSFDPPTLGHIDIVKRVQPLFDRIHLVVAKNQRKSGMFSPEERADLFREALKGRVPEGSVQVDVHDGLLVDYCHLHNANVLIRGLRVVSDFEVELQMASMNRHLAPGIETLHIMTDEKYSFVSSSLIKELAFFRSDLSEWVPENVAQAMQRKNLQK
jgi:pantetheine-phosphate adenylyltransferase